PATPAGGELARTNRERPSTCRNSPTSFTQSRDPRIWDYRKSVCVGVGLSGSSLVLCGGAAADISDSCLTVVEKLLSRPWHRRLTAACVELFALLDVPFNIGVHKTADERPDHCVAHLPLRARRSPTFRRRNPVTCSLVEGLECVMARQQHHARRATPP